MQRCELAEECCVCDVPFCPYEDEGFDADAADEDEFDEDGW